MTTERRIHWGWFRRAPWTDADVTRIKREHPHWFAEKTSPWWVLPGKERT